MLLDKTGNILATVHNTRLVNGFLCHESWELILSESHIYGTECFFFSELYSRAFVFIIMCSHTYNIYSTYNREWRNQSNHQSSESNHVIQKHDTTHALTCHSWLIHEWMHLCMGDNEVRIATVKKSKQKRERQTT